MNFKTNYPYVFVHGMFGFGDGDMLHDYMPYWGMMAGSLPAYLNDRGFQVYTPKVGPASSAWDRACELYAQLTGTRVDYGVAHSKKFGHKRFGRTFDKPLFEGWGPEKKVNFFGHSFGGATCRILSTLMAQGDADEIAATPENEISPLFTGGKDGWIYSITCVACVHNGTTLIYSAPKFIKFLKYFSYGYENLNGFPVFGKMQQTMMEQWELNGFENGHVTMKKWNPERQKAAMESKDSIFYDLTPIGAKECNEKYRELGSIYYFSWPCCKTSQQTFNFKRHRETPRLSMSPMFWFMGNAVGNYPHNTGDEVETDEHWLRNDGLVPTISETYPFNQPHEDMHDAKKYKPGIWYVHDELPYDHLGAVGGFFPPQNGEKLRQIYFDQMRLINEL